MQEVFTGEWRPGRIGMIDIHTHILPFLDDGAATYSEAVEMCRLSSLQGVDAIVVTPHMSDDLFNVSPKRVFAGLKELRRRCREAGIPTTLFPGGDVHVHPDLLKKLDSQEVLTVANRGRFLLIELPQQATLRLLGPLFEGIMQSGVTPVITHPERNLSVMRRPTMLASLVETGCLVQVTAGSLLGAFGRAVKLLAWRLISWRLVHVVASDAHSVNCRPPVLGECADEVRARCGESLVDELFYVNPAKLVAGEAIPVSSPSSAGRASRRDDRTPRVESLSVGKRR